MLHRILCVSMISDIYTTYIINIIYFYAILGSAILRRHISKLVLIISTFSFRGLFVHNVLHLQFILVCIVFLYDSFAVPPSINHVKEMPELNLNSTNPSCISLGWWHCACISLLAVKADFHSLLFSSISFCCYSPVSHCLLVFRVSVSLRWMTHLPGIQKHTTMATNEMACPCTCVSDRPRKNHFVWLYNPPNCVTACAGVMLWKRIFSVFKARGCGWLAFFRVI